MAKVLKENEQFTYDNEVVFKEYYAALCLFASRIVASNDDAHDIVQDIFVKIIEAKRKFVNAGHLQNHLYLAVRNASLDYLKKHGPTKKGELTTDHINEISHEAETIEIEVYRQLARALERLPNECRKVVELAYIQELDNQQVADAMGISVNTVKAQKMRAKKLLRERLKNNIDLSVVAMVISSLSGL